MSHNSLSLRESDVPTKTRLGRSPLRTSLGVRDWNCVKLVFGPSPLLWPLSLPLHQATFGSWPYGWAVSTSGPTLTKRRSRRREPGHRQLGTAVHQGEALAVEVVFVREVGAFCGISVTPPGQGPKQGGRRGSQYRGVDSTRRGKAPPLAVFGDFLAAESYPSGASPTGALASAKEIGEGQSLRHSEALRIRQFPLPDSQYTADNTCPSFQSARHGCPAR